MILKIHTAFAAIAIKNNLENGYMIWCVARTISNGGKTDISELKKIYMTIYKCHEKTFINHLKSCNNILYSITGNYLYLKSINILFNQYDSVIKISSCLTLDSSVIMNNDLKARQILINCVLSADKKNKPLSLSYISKALGINKSTITRNINKSLVYVKTNSRINKNDMFKFWSSYVYVAGQHLPSAKEKDNPKFKTLAKTCPHKLIKVNDDWKFVLK